MEWSWFLVHRVASPKWTWWAKKICFNMRFVLIWHYSGQNISADKIFGRQTFSADKIFGSKSDIRHFFSVEILSDKVYLKHGLGTKILIKRIVGYRGCFNTSPNPYPHPRLNRWLYGGEVPRIWNWFAEVEKLWSTMINPNV